MQYLSHILLPNSLFQTQLPLVMSEVTEEEIINTVSSLGPPKIIRSWKCLQLIISSVSPSKSAIQYCTITLESSQCVRRDPNNYRPISVISVMGKVFERVVYVRLMNVQYLNDNSILTLFQSGFRPNHSTEDVLLCTVEDWYTVKTKLLF